MASDIGSPFRLAARVLLYASSHRQDNTYHSNLSAYPSGRAETKRAIVQCIQELAPTKSTAAVETVKHNSGSWCRWRILGSSVAVYIDLLCVLIAGDSRPLIDSASHLKYIYIYMLLNMKGIFYYWQSSK